MPADPSTDLSPAALTPAAPRARKSARAAKESAPSENPDLGLGEGEAAAARSGADASFSPPAKPTSRAIDLQLPEEEVTRLCAAAGIAISAIEPLLRGGTHLVCSTSDGAATMRRLHAREILVGPQKRSPFFVPTLQRQ